MARKMMKARKAAPFEKSSKDADKGMKEGSKRDQAMDKKQRKK